MEGIFKNVEFALREGQRYLLTLVRTLLHPIAFARDERPDSSQTLLFVLLSAAVIGVTRLLEMSRTPALLWTGNQWLALLATEAEREAYGMAGASPFETMRLAEIGWVLGVSIGVAAGTLFLVAWRVAREVGFKAIVQRLAIPISAGATAAAVASTAVTELARAPALPNGAFLSLALVLLAIAAYGHWLLPPLAIIGTAGIPLRRAALVVVTIEPLVLFVLSNLHPLSWWTSLTVPQRGQRTQVLIENALDALNRRDWDEALQYAGEARELSPRNLEAELVRIDGLTYRFASKAESGQDARSEYAETIAALAKMAKDYPDLSSVQLYVGHRLVVLTDCRAAETAFHTVLRTEDVLPLERIYASQGLACLPQSNTPRLKAASIWYPAPRSPMSFIDTVRLRLASSQQRSELKLMSDYKGIDFTRTLDAPAMFKNLCPCKPPG
jgi:hypothetical protein